MTAGPREYDREYRRSLPGPAQVRIGFDRTRGEVTRFVVQLEYNHGGEWQPVVRYDHDGTGQSEHAHDVTEDGLHIDIYRDGKKEATEYIGPVESGTTGLNRVEDHLAENLQRFIERYEQWHEKGMSEDELEAAEAEIHDLFEELREDLAEDLGGKPADYRADATVADSGD